MLARRESQSERRLPWTAHPQRVLAAFALVGLLVLVALGLRAWTPAATVAVIPAPTMMQSDRRLDLPAAMSDLTDIRFRREFRILVAPHSLQAMPSSRIANRQAEQIQLMEKFSDEHFLIPVFVPVDQETELATALFQGRGDVVATAMPPSVLAQRGLRTTVPVSTRSEHLVARHGDRNLSPADLSGREIAIFSRSGFWPRLRSLRATVPDLQVRILDETTSPAKVLRDVQEMRLDLAVVEIQPGAVGVEPYPDLSLVQGFSTATSLSFGVHPGAEEMHVALDEFLTRERLAQRPQELYRASWAEIKRRGLLRVVTRNNATSYFIWRGRPVGFEYDLIAKFARKHRLSLQMIVPERDEQLLDALSDGRGDVVAAPLPIASVGGTRGIELTEPYMRRTQLFVTAKDSVPIDALDDLAGRRLYLPKNAVSRQRLERLAERIGFELAEIPDTLDTDEVLERLSSGEFDVTIADRENVNVARMYRGGITEGLALGEPVELGWAVRAGNSELLERLNAFIAAEYRTLEYNMLRTRYFDNSAQVRSHMTQRAGDLSGGSLSPYDELVQQHAAKHGFDWPLIVAVMYRESRFDPKVTSLAGAQGLMQVLPVTARRFGITNLKVPENSIAAGVRMMSWLYRRLEPSLPVRERIWFTLAAYNAGLGHLKDARRLAKQLELDPDRWFDNVERAMLLLSKPEYYRKARHGYVRGREPVAYVRDIRDLYDAYRSLLRS